MAREYGEPLRQPMKTVPVQPEEILGELLKAAETFRQICEFGS